MGTKSISFVHVQYTKKIKKRVYHTPPKHTQKILFFNVLLNFRHILYVYTISWIRQAVIYWEKAKFKFPSECKFLLLWKQIIMNYFDINAVTRFVSDK